MDETLHANIFFFITSVAVVAFTLMLLVVMWYVIAILREVKKITTKLSKASEGLEQDIEHIRSEIRNGAMRVSTLLSTVGGFFLNGFGRPKKHSITKKKSLHETKGEESV